MLQIHNILYPTDLSPCSEAALPLTLDLARRHDATLHLMHVLPTFDPSPTAPILDQIIVNPDEYRRLEEDASRGVAALIEQYEASDLRIKRVLVQGEVVGLSLLAYAQSEGIDIVVIGTHGRHGVKKLLLRSTANELIRHAECPVLTVHSGQAKRIPSKDGGHVLAPIDFSDCSRFGLAHAVELAQEYRAPLHLLHIVDPMLQSEVYTAGLVERGRVLAKLERAAIRRLARWSKRMAKPDVTVSYHVRSGNAAEQILHHAAEHASGMIVLASQGRRGLEHFPLGSVAEHVVRSTLSPVFIARPMGKSLVPTDTLPGAPEKNARHAIS